MELTKGRQLSEHKMHNYLLALSTHLSVTKQPNIIETIPEMTFRQSNVLPSASKGDFISSSSLSV